MATGPKIVHKQFNSPMGLYSQQNIKETLSKHMQNLDNGTVGIDFQNPTTDKPANLANSAVLRMLEEEERTRRGYPKLDPTQVQAILDTLVHADHRFDSSWPPERGRMRSARSWDGQLNANNAVYSDFLKATKGQKKVVWPPAPETNGYHSQNQQAPTYNNAQQPPSAQSQYPPQHQAPNQQYQAANQQYQTPNQQYQAPNQQYQAPNQQYQAPNQQYQAPNQQYQTPNQQYQVPNQQYQAPNQQYQAPNQQYQAPQQPGHCEGRRQESTGLSKLIPVGPGVTANPVSPQYRQAPQPPRVDVGQDHRQQAPSRWAPVQSPLSPQGYGQQPQYSPQSQQYSPQSQQFSPQSQQFSPQSQQYSPQQQQFSPQPQQYPTQPPYQAPQFEPPPSTITLRPQPPIHQKPPPVFASQPATATFKGGVNMRGDNKWPPQSVKEAVEAENEARRQLAKGPACRPRKVRKDYTAFFAQNALNQSYPGYKAPPNTQHYEDHPGQSIY